MYFLLALMTLSVAGIVVVGLYLAFSPPRSGLQARRWFKGTVGANLVLFVIRLFFFQSVPTRADGDRCVYHLPQSSCERQ